VTTDKTERFSGLDGLRGIAAAVVVIGHVLLINGQLAEATRDPDADLSLGAAVLTYSPLHLVWAGSEAVMVFFVLSGFVLALPFDAQGRGTWAEYFARRLPRLYLPIWGAVVLAVALVAAVPRASDHASWWLNAHAGSLDARSLLKLVTVLDGPGILIDGPLWSMRYEILFSLLLPIYFLFAMRWRKATWIKIAALLVMTSIGSALESKALMYMPSFAIGCCLASVRGSMVLAMSRLSPRAFWAILLGGLLCLNAPWTSSAVRGDDVSRDIAFGVSIAGAATMVMLFAGGRPTVALGNSSVCQWLGRISFSLYLVHEPIIVSVANLRPGWGVATVLVVSLALVIPASQLFYWSIERPAHLLARRVGRIPGWSAQWFVRAAGRTRAVK
jgi:peptidoglycan/LPS O-acetylase OafA/YrhL